MNNRSALLCDLDGVLCNTIGSVLGRLYTDYGLGLYREAEVTSWDILDCIPGLTEEILFDIFQTPDFWDEVLPYPGARDFLNSLAQEHTIHIVTDRRWYPALKDQTAAWLRSHGFLYDFLAIEKGKEKHLYTQAHGLRVAVEDNIRNAVSLSSVAHTVLIDRPWNRTLCLENHLWRAFTYNQAAIAVDYAVNYSPVTLAPPPFNLRGCETGRISTAAPNSPGNSHIEVEA